MGKHSPCSSTILRTRTTRRQDQPVQFVSFSDCTCHHPSTSTAHQRPTGKNYFYPPNSFILFVFALLANLVLMIYMHNIFPKRCLGPGHVPPSLGRTQTPVGHGFPISSIYCYYILHMTPVERIFSLHISLSRHAPSCNGLTYLPVNLVILTCPLSNLSTYTVRQAQSSLISESGRQSRFASPGNQ